MRAVVHSTGSFGFADVVVGFVGAVVCAAVVLGSSGCSECSTDQDCAAKLGSPDLLCIDGSCKSGTPDEAPATPCARNADCDDGELCFDDACVIVPTCQRLVGNFVARRVGTNDFGAVAASTDGCAVSLSIAISGGRTPIAANVSAERITNDGQWIGLARFSGGRWLADKRVATLDGFDGANGPTILFGTNDYACVTDADCAGQVHETCRTACAGGDGCAADAPCDAAGLCRAASRGTCQ